LVALVAALVLVAASPACDGEGDVAATGSGGSAATNSGGAGTGGDIGFTNGSGGDPIMGTGGVGGVCASETIQADRAEATMLFLIDRSGSMNCNVPPIQSSTDCEATPAKADPNEPSKWEITSTALDAAFTALEGYDPLPQIGIAYFNSDNYCGFPTAPDVDIAALSGDAATDVQLQAIQDSLTAVSPQGSTPIIGTTMGAWNYLYMNQASFDGILFVVLLTDGAETCDPANVPLLISKATEAASVGIRTFVLGAPGSENARATLSQIAFNGDTATDPNCDHSGAPADAGDCHMDMTLPGLDFATELANNLATISEQALSCIFDVPEPPPGDPPVDLTKVNVVHQTSGGMDNTVPQDYSVPCDDPNNMGWQYTNNNSQIELCGAACEAVLNDPGGQVTIQLGCATMEVPQ
jgi:hypothetical protein